MTRPLCIQCNMRPAAINYKKEGKTFYRSKCEPCNRYNGEEKGIPNWRRDGFRLKTICDKCGFKSPYKEQFNVFFIDGDLNNTRPSNLKCVCANCQRILHKEGVIWKQGDLRPDF